jgi:hypothetical protein
MPKTGDAQSVVSPSGWMGQWPQVLITWVQAAGSAAVSGYP